MMKFHQDKAAFQKKLKREENARLKRIAGGIAKEVKQFWRQIEKVSGPCSNIVYSSHQID